MPSSSHPLAPADACSLRGGWVVTNLLATDIANDFVCAALPHPSINLEEKVFGGSLADLMSRVDRPILLMPGKVS